MDNAPAQMHIQRVTYMAAPKQRRTAKKYRRQNIPAHVIKNSLCLLNIRLKISAYIPVKPN